MSTYTTSASIAMTGNASYLTSHLQQPLLLDPSKEYQIAMVDFTVYNSIPNIYDGNNRFYFDTDKYIQIPTGSYEITAISDYLTSLIGEDKLKLKANNNTLKCEIWCYYDVNFTPEDSIGYMLGFSGNKLERQKTHNSDLPVNITKVNSINILCNLVTNSFSNGKRRHVIHSFYPHVPSGHKILETPSNLIYLPVNKTDKIEHIILKITDQDEDLINFRGEQIFVRLHIKQWE